MKCLNEVRYVLLQGALPDYYQNGLELLCPPTDPVSASVSILTATGVPLALLTFLLHGEDGATTQAPSCVTRGRGNTSAPTTSLSVSISSSPWEGGGQSDWSGLGPQFIGRKSLELKGDHFMISAHVLLGDEPSWSFCLLIPAPQPRN